MEGGGERAAEAEEYHCHDFEWEDLRAEVEANPAFSYHLSPFPTTVGTPETPPPPPPSEAWTSFHRRHTCGKFFKVSISALLPVTLRRSVVYFFFSGLRKSLGIRISIVRDRCSSSWRPPVLHTC